MDMGSVSSGGGMLGLNDAINRSSPTQVPGTWNWFIEVAEYASSCIQQ